MTKDGPRCHECPLKDAKGIVWGVGNPNARLVVIGMAPGEEEIKANEPFVGRSGQLLDQTFRKVGISRPRSYITNVVKCFVEPGKPIPAKAVDCCAPLMQKELDMLQYHDTILTLGGEAFHAFTHKKLLTQSPMRKGHKKPPDPNVWLRGCVYHIGRARVIIPAVHPAFLLRQGLKDILFFERDLDRARRFSEGLGAHHADTYNYSPSSTEVRKYINECTSTGEFGVDIETSYADADEEERVAEDIHKITVVGLSARPGECVGVPPDLLPLLTPLFQRRDRKLRCYAYNWGFDGYHLGKMFDLSGIQPFDVMKAFYLCYSDSQRHDLATALSWWTDMPYHKNLQFTQPDLYNARDTWGVLVAGRAAEKEMRQLGLLDLFWTSEMPLIQVMSDMEHIGVNCDVHQAQKIELTCYKLLAKYEEYWKTKIPNISWSSPQQLILLFKNLGLPVQYKIRIAKDKSRKRTECCDEEVLELYRDAHKSQLAGLVLFMRKLKKAADFTHIYSSDGRAHARYMDQRGGRIQAKEPDLQNIPEELEAGGITVLPRTIIIPDDPDNDCIISADFEAIEFFIYGYACQDTAILKARKDGTYIYGLFYQEIFKKPFFQEGMPPKKWYKRRDIPAWELLVAKSAPLGMLYGRGIPSLRTGLGIKHSDAERIYNDFHKEHPGVRSHHTELTFQATRVGYLQNYFGRIRRFPNPRMSHNEILSFTGQSNAADILRLNALLPLYKGLRDFSARLLLTVHDSVAISCPRRNLTGCVEYVRETLEAPIAAMNNFWIPCTIKVGTKETSTTGKPNWGDCIPYDDWMANFGSQRTGATRALPQDAGVRPI
jgi:uracil-DNA glycosylase family 4